MSARRWPQLPPVHPSLRPSVRPTSSSPPPPPQPGRPGPAQRHPEQPRPREETGAASARPCPAPFFPSVRPSVRPPARPCFRPSVRPPALGPASLLSPLCLSLARCLFVSALALSAPPSLQDLGSPLPALLSSLTATDSGTSILRDSLDLFGGLSFRTHCTPPRPPLSLPHILRVLLDP